MKAVDLAYYDVASHTWRVEPSGYTVLAGGSSRATDLLSVGLRVEEAGATERP